MRVAVYDPSTGDILRVIECPDFAAPLQAQTGEAWVEVGPDIGDATHKIVSGTPTPL